MGTAISLFAGAGGCSLGFQWAGYDILLAVDNNRDAVQTYRVNFPDTPCWEEDITHIAAEDVLQFVGAKPTEIDFLIGGPPCQGFSSAGARFWDDPRNELLMHYVRLIRDIQPRWFLMENVEGLLTADKGRYTYEVAKGFLEAGYNIRIHKLYSHWYGLPQSRKRVFIVGIRDDKPFDFPVPTHVEHPDLFNQTRVLSVLDGVGDLPHPAREPEARLLYATSPHNSYQARLRGAYVTEHWIPEINGDALARIQALKPGQTMKHLPQELQHPSFQRRSLRRVMDGTPTEKRGGAPAGLKRLRPDVPSLTITSAAPREFVHPEQDRYLTIRECARLQSFPDNFQFCGSASAKIMLIGNAIPPLIAYQLATHFDRISTRQNTARCMETGSLLGFFLTKADSMSPALARTATLLTSLNQPPRG
ncbi:MAG: DNA cytosine methyltransferase [Anaerolineae bacterium]|nr:DNA cytosine methyltransferase [Anaerolineae bacterium]